MSARALDWEAAVEAMVTTCGGLVGDADPKRPVALKPLLESFEARSEPREMSADGLLRRDRDGYVINFPPKGTVAWQRQRFTVAHELAHLVLLERLGSFGREIATDGEWSAVERLCNIGAAEILLPRGPFAAALEELGFSRAGLAVLFERFGVSWSALFIRIAEILGDAAIALWDRRGSEEREEDPTLRLSRLHRGTRRFWLPKGLSGRYLKPNLVDGAAAEGFVAGDDFSADFGSEPLSGRAIALSLRRLRRPTEQRLPGMSEHELKQLPYADVALLVLPEPESSSALIEAVWQRSVYGAEARQMELSLAI